MTVVDARRTGPTAGGYVYVSPPRPPEDDWIAVAGRSFIAVVEAGEGDRGITELLRLAGDSDVPLETIVSAVPVGELGADSFAVVHVDSEEDPVGPAQDGSRRVTAVARGRAVVDVFSDGGSRRFSSSGIQPWLIATFRDVIAVELGGPARGSGAVARLAHDAQPLDSAAAPAGAALWSVLEMRHPDAGGAGAPYVRPAAALDEDTVRSIDVIDEDTIRRPRPTGDGVASSRGRHAGVALRDPESDRVEERDIEETVRRSPAFPQFDEAIDPAPDEETAQRVALPARQGDAAGPDPLAKTGVTVAAQPSSEHVVSTGHEERADPAAKHPAPVLVDVHGAQAVVLDAPIIVGRRPTGAPRGGHPPLLITVASRDSLVSGSHVRIERAGNVVVVTDLRSRNGTAVILPGAAPRRLRPGESFAVPGAAKVEIGDGTIIEITPVAPVEDLQGSGGCHTTALSTDTREDA